MVRQQEMVTITRKKAFNLSSNEIGVAKTFHTGLIQIHVIHSSSTQVYSDIIINLRQVLYLDWEFHKIQSSVLCILFVRLTEIICPVCQLVAKCAYSRCLYVVSMQEIDQKGLTFQVPLCHIFISGHKMPCNFIFSFIETLLKNNETNIEWEEIS